MNITNLIRKISYCIDSVLSKKVVNCNGVRLIVQNQLLSDTIKRSIYRRSYEKVEISILRQTLGNNDKVLELGSCMGFLGAYVSKSVGSENVVLVEANPYMIPLLKSNLANNGVSPLIINAMVGSKDENDMPFYLMSDVWSSSAINKNQKNSHTIQVKSITLAKLLSEVRPTYLIVDIEGGERDILNTAVLSDSTVQKICIEIHPKYIGNQCTSKLIQDIEAASFQADWNLCRENTFYFTRVSDV
jgi:FkbM family methyltransferase